MLISRDLGMPAELLPRTRHLPRLNSVLTSNNVIGIFSGFFCLVTSHKPPMGDLAHNPGTCPNWELNQ